MCPTSFWSSRTTDDWQFIVCKITPTSQAVSSNLAYLGNGTYNQINAHLEQELKLSGLEADGQLPIPTMATSTSKVNKQTQPQKAEQQQIILRYCKKPGFVIRECRKRIGKEQE